MFAIGEVKGAPDATSPVKTPYTEVFANYQKAAENALAQEKIPPAYKTRVKEYFSSLTK